MQFHMKKKHQMKQIKRMMWHCVAKGTLSRKTIRKIYIRKPVFNYQHICSILSNIKQNVFPFIKQNVFPFSRTAYKVVLSAAVLSAFLFYVCNITQDLNMLSKENEALLHSNDQLASNVESLNSAIAYNKNITRIQQETILNQQASLSEIEKTVETIEEQYKENLENLTSQKDEALQRLMDMIRDLDIFSTIVSRSGDLTAASSQIAEAKDTIRDLFGDTEEADWIIEKLDSENAKIIKYQDSYPDFYPTNGFVSSKYGYRRDPFTGATSFHSGLDIANSAGTSIYASATGTVIQSGWNGEYGYSILIDHGNGFQTRYAHCSKLLVSVGTSVSKGQRIALMGDTGRATGSHLHFEVILNGSTQNPVNYIG